MIVTSVPVSTDVSRANVRKVNRVIATPKKWPDVFIETFPELAKELSVDSENLQEVRFR